MTEVNRGLIQHVSRRLVAFSVLALMAWAWNAPARGQTASAQTKSQAFSDPPTTPSAVSSDYTLTTKPLTIPYKLTRDANGVVLAPAGKVELSINGVRNGKPLTDPVGMTISGSVQTIPFMSGAPTPSPTPTPTPTTTATDGTTPGASGTTPAPTAGGIPFRYTTPAPTQPGADGTLKVDITEPVKSLLKDLSPFVETPFAPSSFDKLRSFKMEVNIKLTPFVASGKEAPVNVGNNSVGNTFELTFQLSLGTPSPAPAASAPAP